VGKLVHAGITSLDGCIADTDGRFDWAVPDEEVHASINDRERAVGTYLFGRRMYAEMAEDPPRDHVSEMRDFAQVCARSTRSSPPAHALAAGLVDECHVYVAPVVLGGGKRFFPTVFGSLSSWWRSTASAVASCTWVTPSGSVLRRLPLIDRGVVRDPVHGPRTPYGAVRRVTGGRPAS
jgi:dihydrofolate reductase